MWCITDLGKALEQERQAAVRQAEYARFRLVTKAEDQDDEHVTHSHARAAGRAEYDEDPRPGHAPAFMGDQENLHGPHTEDDEAEKGARHDVRHQVSGRFIPEVERSWPGMTEHIAAGPTSAPAPLATVHTSQGADRPGSAFQAGTATVQRLNYAEVSPFSVSVSPAQPPFRTAPTGYGARR